MYPFSQCSTIEELQVKGSALVTAIDDCPEIADGEGSLVTARFCTREVHTVAQVEFLGTDGQIETITGTTIHPVWSEDKQDWVPLGELRPGERLRGEQCAVTVLSVTIVNQAVPVYNIEVHGEHVYQVGELGLLVHNACEGVYEFTTKTGLKYIGQSVDVLRRLKQHKKLIDSTQSISVIPISGGKTARELFELARINALGGIEGGQLANKVLPISLARLAEILGP